MSKQVVTVDEYIALQPVELSTILARLRDIVLTCAPEVSESMAYGMPAYKTYGKPLVYFAAFKSHVGFYATPSGHEKFKDKLASYKQGKGSVQFPFDRPMPYDLIEEIVRFRVRENEEKHGRVKS